MPKLRVASLPLRDAEASSAAAASASSDNAALPSHAHAWSHAEGRLIPTTQRDGSAAHASARANPPAADYP
ncbi:MAG: hypothetical protein ACK40L_19650, partial [Hydrogenophaga sp.]